MTSMQTKTPPDLRSFDEMKKIYDQLYKEGKVDDPYIVQVSTKTNILIFFGARHSNNVDDPQNKSIETLWDEFIAHDNANKIALCEGGLRPLEETSGEVFDVEKKKLLYSLSDPYSNPVSASSSVFRDVSIFAAIQKYWAQGKDIFIVYGSGHAIVLEKALQNLNSK